MSDPPAGYPVVVLAGGLGTRMAHIAPDLPKALVPVLGEPFAFHQLRLLAAQGVRDVLYVVGDLSRRGELAGYEVSERFYEIGSPGGLAELEAYLSAALHEG